MAIVSIPFASGQGSGHATFFELEGGFVAFQSPSHRGKGPDLRSRRTSLKRAEFQSPSHRGKGPDTACLSREIQRQDPQPPNQTNTDRAALAFISLSSASGLLELLNRHELRFKRQYQRTLHMLLSLRAAQTPNPALPGEEK